MEVASDRIAASNGSAGPDMKTPLCKLLGGPAGLCLLMFAAPWSACAEDEVALGRRLYSDLNLSLHRNQSCASCHGLSAVTNRFTGLLLPAPGFVDPENVVSNTPVSRGSVAGRTGALNAPSAAYAAFSPDFHWDSSEGLYVGGQFWNGRASTLQAQAALPLLNPLEMAMPSRWAVVTRLRENFVYRQLFQEIFALDLSAIPPNELADETLEPPAGVRAAYDAMAQAIAEFERSRAFSPFTSKFDFWLAGRIDLSPAEKRGFILFTNQAGCSACHLSEPTLAPGGQVQPPLFTDFTYDNIGLPKNLKIPGVPSPDLGLGGRAEIRAAPAGAEQIGKHKVMTLRNIAVTAPYGHNGVLETLEQVVHFYNTRDGLGRVPSNTDPGFGVAGWPEPEVPQNVNAEELGNLGLLAEDEADLVAFLRTLTDQYPEWGGDPKVPPGTPSPFAEVPIPGIPAVLAADSPGAFRLFGHLGRSYSLEHTDSLGQIASWQSVGTSRLTMQGLPLRDPQSPAAAHRFYRVRQLP